MNEFELMDRKDEAQILAELKGAYSKKFVYQFQQGKNTVTGISWSGIKEIAFRIGNIKTEINENVSDDEEYAFIVRATNTETGSSMLGVGNCKKTEGFARQKALSKAQRNAIRGVIPEATIELYLTEFTQDKNNIETIKEQPRRKIDVEVKIEDVPPTGIYAPSDLSVDSIKQYLDDCGYDSEKFTIRHDEPSRMYVFDKAPWIDDWSSFQDRMRELGADYDQTHKKTVVKY